MEAPPFDSKLLQELEISSHCQDDQQASAVSQNKLDKGLQRMTSTGGYS